MRSQCLYRALLCFGCLDARKHWEDLASKMGSSHSFVLSSEIGKMHDNLLREAKQLYAKCGFSEKVTPGNREQDCVSLVFACE